ncbi:MAG: sulfotransferase [Acidobacteria bacterium]|nr:sulfotransferase [Acidobacteriota bacterium]
MSPAAAYSRAANMPDLLRTYAPPVVIGGVGGSGTRLIARCLLELGFFMGSDLNHANDNLWFTFLFNRIESLSASEEDFDELTEILFKGMTGSDTFTPKQIDLISGLALQERKPHSPHWLRQRAHSLLSAKSRLPQSTRWGWKEPNTHVVVDRLRPRLGAMRYIHVARNGLDMAYSTNQNQLRLWGQHFVGKDCTISPYHSLKYWCIVHRRVLDICSPMGTDFLFLNYDEFCLNPRNGMGQLVEFLGLAATDGQTLDLTGLIRAPNSIGRFKRHDINVFDEGDVAFVKQLGFDINIGDK